MKNKISLACRTSVMEKQGEEVGCSLSSDVTGSSQSRKSGALDPDLQLLQHGEGYTQVYSGLVQSRLLIVGASQKNNVK